VVKEAQRARRIVRDLLAFARQERLERRLTDLNHLLRETVALVRYQLERGGIMIEEQYTAQVGSLYLNGEQIKQVFVNLINNALQSMPTGGTLRLSTARLDDQVTVSISDTGVGIPPEEQQCIFEPFFSTKPAGTGLGLAISQEIAQKHQGCITVESTLGEGSTFTLWLPQSVGETAGDASGCGQSSRSESRRPCCRTLLRFLQVEDLVEGTRKLLCEKTQLAAAGREVALQEGRPCWVKGG
jgi:signal transduction histidine kinase